MKKLILASALIFSVAAAQQGFAQSTLDAIKKESDQTQGLAKNPPPQPATGLKSETPADKAAEKLRDSMDQSTGLPMGAPPQPTAGRKAETPADRAAESLRDRQDMSTGLPKK